MLSAVKKIPLPSECSPHLPLLDLAANDLPPLLNDVNQDVALLHELTLLTGRVHLRTNSQAVLDEQKYGRMLGMGGYIKGYVFSGSTSCRRRGGQDVIFIHQPALLSGSKHLRKMKHIQPFCPPLG